VPKIEGRKLFDSSAKADPSQSCGKASNFNMTMVEEGWSIKLRGKHAKSVRRTCMKHAMQRGRWEVAVGGGCRRWLWEVAVGGGRWEVGSGR